MKRLETTCVTDSEGVVHLRVPLGEARRCVKVVLEYDSAPTEKDRMRWKKFIESISGSIDDDSFQAPAENMWAQANPEGWERFKRETEALEAKKRAASSVLVK